MGTLGRYAVAAALLASTSCADVPNPNYGEDASTAGGGTAGSGASGGASGVGGTGGSTGKGRMDADAVDSGDSGPGEGGVDEGGPEPCDETGTPKTESCLVSDVYAAFVAPSGSAGAVGTTNAPVSTIAGGIAAANDRGLRFVIVCGGDYTEPLVITTGGVAVHGGFDCGSGGWRWDEDAATRVRPSTGVALRIQNAKEPVFIEDMVFAVEHATDNGQSSIAAVIEEAAEVSLRNVALIAGAGADGQNGSTANYSFPNRATELDGNDALGLTGGLRKLVTCPGGAATAGGKGGDGGVAPEEGSDGAPASPKTSSRRHKTLRRAADPHERAQPATSVTVRRPRRGGTAEPSPRSSPLRP